MSIEQIYTKWDGNPAMFLEINIYIVYKFSQRILELEFYLGQNRVLLSLFRFLTGFRLSRARFLWKGAAAALVQSQITHCDRPLGRNNVYLL